MLSNEVGIGSSAAVQISTRSPDIIGFDIGHWWDLPDLADVRE
jgi:hypothetical protein